MAQPDTIAAVRLAVEPILDRDKQLAYRIVVHDVQFTGNAEFSTVRDVAIVDTIAIAVQLLQTWPLAPASRCARGEQMKEKLEVLRDRLAAAQNDLITHAANTNALPSENALRKIADLEVAIGALEGLMDEPLPSNGSPRN